MVIQEIIVHTYLTASDVPYTIYPPHVLKLKINLQHALSAMKIIQKITILFIKTYKNFTVAQKLF